MPKTSLANGIANKLQPADRPAHEWYRFVLSFPPHLVRDYMARFGLDEGARVLDPFCGTGTTLVECKKQGIASVGIEANPMAHFACRVKTHWTPSPKRLRERARKVADATLASLRRDGIDDSDPAAFSPARQCASSLKTLSAEQFSLLLHDSISPIPLHKALVLLGGIDDVSEPGIRDLMRLALAKRLVDSIGNLHFGPEVGIGEIKDDAAVVPAWLEQVESMARDLASLQSRPPAECAVHRADAREIERLLEPESLDAVFTSPPYPNEKDYTRTTRLESVILGFIRDKRQLREMKQGLVRSNTRNVYASDTDDEWITGHPEIQRVADDIERRRIELGKTSGFERLYARVTRLYFGGMARHLAGLRPAMRPGAMLGYVVGDQASYLRIMIRTGRILAEIADSLGYEVVGIDLFRTRHATATGEQLREEVVALRWPGKKSRRTVTKN